MIAKDNASIRNLMQDLGNHYGIDEMTEGAKKTASPQKLVGSDISLSLSIMGSGDPQNSLRKKLRLIREFKLADPDTLVRILKTRASQTGLSVEDRALLEQFWKNAELDDLDLTELFVCFLPTIIDRQSSKFLASLDPQPFFNKHKCGDLYEEFIKASVRKSAAEVKRFVLPRVRAKLAVKEIVCLITSDPAKIAELIKISPRYLACPTAANLIAKYRSGQLSSDVKVRRKSESALGVLSQGIFASTKLKPRRYGYWKIDYYFNEVVACIKISNTLPKIADRRDYIRTVNLIWRLPEGYPEILINTVKNPAEITLEIMVAKGMITDASTYRNVIKPHVKKLKMKYPSIRACDYLVEHLLDIPTKDPNRFSHFDLWKQLETFHFDLTDKELKIGHSISYPTTVYRV